jgi:hypothetical protein
MKSITSKINLFTSILYLVVVSCVKGIDMKEISTYNLKEN